MCFGFNWIYYHIVSLCLCFIVVILKLLGCIFVIVPSNHLTIFLILLYFSYPGQTSIYIEYNVLLLSLTALLLSNQQGVFTLESSDQFSQLTIISIKLLKLIDLILELTNDDIFMFTLILCLLMCLNSRFGVIKIFTIHNDLLY